MSALKILAIALIVGGIVGLAYGKFSYTKDSHGMKLGAMEVSVKKNETVNIALWAGVLAFVAGGIMLAVPPKNVSVS